MELQKRRAFTLLEIMIATGILGCALVALLTSVNQSHKMNQKAVALLEQSLLAKAKIEEILLLENLSESSVGSGRFDNSEFFSYSFTTSKMALPFGDAALAAKESNILEVVLFVEDKRTPNSSYKITSYSFGKTQ